MQRLLLLVARIIVRREMLIFAKRCSFLGRDADLRGRKSEVEAAGVTKLRQQHELPC